MPELQGKLLRFLEEHRFERVGSDRTQSVDVRVVAATNRDLDAEVRAGRFREDLFFRLNVVALRLPALRDRTEDIGPLIEHLLADARGPSQPAGAVVSRPTRSARSRHTAGRATCASS